MTTLTKSPTRADLLQRKADIGREIRRFRDKVSRPNAVLSDEDSARVDDLLAERQQLEADLERAGTPPGPAQERTFRAGEVGYSPPAVEPGRHPLAYTPQALDALQAALDTRTAGRFAAGDEQQERAALATGTYGAPRAWGANVLAGPRLLHMAARVPQQRVDAVAAQLPTLTLPTAGASVGENVTLAEYAASTAGSVTLARYGRWTDLSRESLVGTDAGAIVGAHTVGVALDLDLALITLVNTAAGSAVAFTADVPAAVRKGIALITSNTAAVDAADIVIMVHPDNASLLQDIAPIGGVSIAEQFSRFSGSLVYPSTAVPTGFALVANLTAGVRYFEARGLQSETDVNIKTGTVTVASSVISGYGNALAGYVTKIDIVTP
jgi:hypothetical protein